MAESHSTRRPHNFIDLTGLKFGRLTVASQAESRVFGGTKTAHWNCLCECGTATVVSSAHLRTGHTVSCGCIRPERWAKTHGMSGTDTYIVWSGMIQRCYDINTDTYARYGAIGVGVCDRWRESFEAFLADMGERPSKLHSIDRYPDQNGNYEPGNCRWATATQQNRNRKTNTLLTHNGETATLIEWSHRFGVKSATILYRLRHGWPVFEAITVAPNSIGNRKRF